MRAWRERRNASATGASAKLSAAALVGARSAFEFDVLSAPGATFASASSAIASACTTAIALDGAPARSGLPSLELELCAGWAGGARDARDGATSCASGVTGELALLGFGRNERAPRVSVSLILVTARTESGAAPDDASAGAGEGPVAKAHAPCPRSPAICLFRLALPVRCVAHGTAAESSGRDARIPAEPDIPPEPDGTCFIWLGDGGGELVDGQLQPHRDDEAGRKRARDGAVRALGGARARHERDAGCEWGGCEWAQWLHDTLRAASCALRLARAEAELVAHGAQMHTPDEPTDGHGGAAAAMPAARALERVRSLLGVQGAPDARVGGGGGPDGADAGDASGEASGARVLVLSRAPRVRAAHRIAPLTPEP